MADDEFSAIGTDVSATAPPSELAQKEDRLFALERERENHEHALRLRQHEIGAIGRIFGSRDNAITYMIALLVLISIILFSVFAFSDAKGAPTAMELFKTVCIAGIGYLTGKTVQAKD